MLRPLAAPRGGASSAPASGTNKGRFPGYEIQKPKVGDDVLALLLQLAREASAAVCVETGTFRGKPTVKFAESRHCPKVVIVELNPDFAVAARAKFTAMRAANQDTVLLEGDFGDVLPPNAGLFPDDRNVLWYDSPIIVELDFILRTRAHRGDVVVIDDARTFRGSRLLLNMEVPWLFPESADVIDHIWELQPNMLVDIVGSKAGGAQYLLQFVEPRAVCENTMRRGFAPHFAMRGKFLFDAKTMMIHR
jgi:hypothetical protein